MPPNPDAPNSSSPWRSAWGLDPDVLFLNHGSFGACPTEILEAQQAWRTRLEREPVAFFEAVGREPWDRARAALAEFVGADPADVVFVTNATSGVNSVLRSYAFEPGDEVLTTDHAYHACRKALEFVADRGGITLHVADVPFPVSSPDEVVHAILSRATSRTRLALIDHITSATGLVLPIRRIVDELSARGIDTLVDGAHAPGHVDLDVEAIGAAYYTGNCHKWLCTPKGTAFLHVRRDLHPTVRPLTISHAAALPAGDRFHAEFDWPGTIDPTGVLTIPRAIEYLGSLFPGGWPELRARNHTLALDARDVIGGRLGIPHAAPPDMIGNLVAFPLRSEGELPDELMTPEPLHDRLLEEASIQVPVYRWFSPPRRILRISTQLYNHLDEYRRLADTLEAFGEALTPEAPSCRRS